MRWCVFLFFYFLSDHIDDIIKCMFCLIRIDYTNPSCSFIIMPHLIVKCYKGSITVGMKFQHQEKLNNFNLIYNVFFIIFRLTINCSRRTWILCIIINYDQILEIKSKHVTLIIVISIIIMRVCNKTVLTTRPNWHPVNFLAAYKTNCINFES